MGAKIAYVMSRFPHLPETFILREMDALKAQGWQIALYPLIVQKQVVLHEEAKPWLAGARSLPYFSAGVARANAFYASHNPSGYAAIWRRVLAENARVPGFLARAVLLLPKSAAMARRMASEGVRHVHAHYGTHPALAAWIIHNLTGISYSVTVHAHDIFVERAMLATKLRDATFVVAISEFNREFLSNKVGEWVRPKTRVIHCGIDPACYAMRPPDRSGRLEILNIGSLQPYKGQADLIDACALLRDRGIPIRCRIVGGGEERARLEKRITRLGLAGQVLLLGPLPQNEVARLLPTANCYVQSSIITPSGKMEGIPVALMEALASGVPCVATAISGIPELVKDGVTGILVPPANPPVLADGLAKVFHDRSGAERMAKAGRALVLQEFDVQRNAARLAELFAGVIEDQK